MKQFIAALPLVLLIACDAPTTPIGPDLPLPSDDTCNAGSFAEFIGQDVTALERVLLLGPVRIIRPGQPVTADFRPDRINFMLDRENRITAVSCN